ncbi:MAG: hypothetical protein OEV66_12080, partial [Spirochaetia bacterium]|nr:hypothetical protein [Spirochaetia bacterium]
MKEFITLYQRPALIFPKEGSHEYSFILEAGSLSNTLIFPEYFTFPSAITSPEQILGNSQDTVQSLL